MEDKKKIRLGWAAFFLLCVHFGFIFLFALPEKWKSKEIQSGVASYVNPIFYQKWNMFAPCPVINASAHIQYHFKDSSSQWFRPADKAIETHNLLRFTHHGELVLAEANMLYFLYYDLIGDKLFVEGDTTYFDEIPQHTNGFKKLKTYALGFGEYLYETEIDSCTVICDFIDVRNDSLKTIRIERINQWIN